MVRKNLLSGLFDNLIGFTSFNHSIFYSKLLSAEYTLDKFSFAGSSFFGHIPFRKELPIHALDSVGSSSYFSCKLVACAHLGQFVSGNFSFFGGFFE